MSVILNKIDGKTVCGKVVTNFGRFLGADEYLVVNKEIRADDQQMAMMELSIPGGCEFDVVSPETYAKICKDNDYFGNKTIVVFRYLSDVVKAVEAGATVKKLNCCGIYASEDPNATVYNKNLVLGAEDVKELRKLADHGVELVFQPTVQETEVALSAIVQY